MIKKIIFSLILLINLASAKYVAILETVIDKKDLLTLSERQYLTDLLRGQAVKVLPAEQNFTIMTRENINVMLPPGKSIEDCEGSCLAETGKNIAADYVAQARIGQVGSTMFISVELYETAGNKLKSTFNDRAKDVDDLERVIKENAPEFFKKIKNSDSDLLSAGFITANNQGFIVSLNTNPSGASVSIDGRPMPSCPKTPCEIQMTPGEHRFMTVLHLYDDADSVIVINQENQNILLNMAPNFGTMNLTPDRPSKYGNESDFIYQVDEKKMDSSVTRHSPGVHSVQISHKCYESVSFKALIEKDKTLNYNKPMTIAKGILALSAEQEGLALNLPVYVDGVEIGKTPLEQEIPLCASVTIADQGKMDTIKLDMKKGERYSFTYTPKIADPESIDINKPAKESKLTTKQKLIIRGISLALFAGGLATGLYFNECAADEYHEYKSTGERRGHHIANAEDYQMYRAVGYFIAAVGAFTFFLSYSF